MSKDTKDTGHSSKDVLEELKAISDELTSEKAGKDVRSVMVNLAKVCEMIRGPWLYAPIHGNVLECVAAGEYKKKEIARLAELGKEHGERSDVYPPVGATEPGSEEAKIIDDHKRLYEWYRDMITCPTPGAAGLIRSLLNILTAEIKLYALACSDGEYKYEKNYFRNELQDARSKFELHTKSEELDLSKQENNRDFVKRKAREATGSADPIESSEKDFKDKKNNFTAFCKTHNLKRYPDYYQIGDILFAMLVVILFEAGLNSGFYAAASEAGFIGGALTAFVASLGICSSGYFTGFFWRYKNLKSDDNKWLVNLSWFFALIALIVITFLCLYRDVLSVDPSAELSDIVDRFLSFDIIPTGSIETIMLLIINFVCAGYSFYKGYTARDTMPGYVNVAEELALARRLYKNKIKEEANKINVDEESKRKFEERLKVPSREVITALFGNYKMGVSMYEQLSDIGNAEIENIRNSCHGLLDSYRTANKQARNTSLHPAPEYFDDYPEYDRIKLEAYDAQDVDELEQDGIDINEIQRTLEEHRSIAIQEYTKMYKALKTIRIDHHNIQSETDMREINKRDFHDK